MISISLGLAMVLAGCGKSETPTVGMETTAAVTVETTAVAEAVGPLRFTCEKNDGIYYWYDDGEPPVHSPNPNGGEGLTITGWEGTMPADLVIPDSIDGLPVTQIAQRAFKDCGELRSVTLPETITYIYPSVFEGCANLTDAVILSKVRSVSGNMFKDCRNLANVTLPDTIETIGFGAFEDCASLRSIQLPEHVWLIGDGAFDSTPILEEAEGDFVILNDRFLLAYRGEGPAAVVPDGVEYIAGDGFQNCSQLTEVILPDSFVGSVSFQGCTNLQRVQGLKGMNADFMGCTSLTRFDIPEGATSIPFSAFMHCTSLTEVTIPEGVEHIYHSAFRDCASLRSITIPDSVTRINSHAFAGTPWLEEQTEDFVILNGKLFLKYNGSDAEVKIPQGIETIAGGAFENCSQLTEVTVPEGVVRICDSAFSGCENLRQANLPDSLSYIEGNAFWGCTSLRSVTIPDRVRVIEYYAFRNCSSLAEVILPAGLEYICEGAFEDCTALKNVSIPEGCTVEEGAFRFVLS